METFLEKTYRENKDTVELSILAKDFKEVHSFVRLFERKFKNLPIFDIKLSIIINWKDKNCRF